MNNPTSSSQNKLIIDHRLRRGIISYEGKDVISLLSSDEEEEEKPIDNTVRQRANRFSPKPVVSIPPQNRLPQKLGNKLFFSKGNKPKPIKEEPRQHTIQSISNLIPTPPPSTSSPKISASKKRKEKNIQTPALPIKQTLAQLRTQPPTQPRVQPPTLIRAQTPIQPKTRTPIKLPIHRKAQAPIQSPTQPRAQAPIQPPIQPSTQPSIQPSIQPSTQPSIQPSIQPSTQPPRRVLPGLHKQAPVAQSQPIRKSNELFIPNLTPDKLEQLKKSHPYLNWDTDEEPKPKKIKTTLILPTRKKKFLKKPLANPTPPTPPSSSSPTATSPSSSLSRTVAPTTTSSPLPSLLPSSPEPSLPLSPVDVNDDDEISEDGFIHNAQFRHLLPDWEENIKRIIDVEHNLGKMRCKVEWFDDKWCIYPMDTIKQQCPQKLLDYYESKLEVVE